LRANAGLVWLVAFNLVLDIMGRRRGGSGKSQPTQKSRWPKTSVPKGFVVNYVLSVVIALLLFEMLDGHGLPPFKRSKGMPLFRNA
jgi:hypothetical protein